MLLTFLLRSCGDGSPTRRYDLDEMAGTCAIRLLGSFEVITDGHRVTDDAWRHRRGADLVKLLALAPAHRLHREQVIEALWPDLPPEAADANLRKATLYARRALGSDVDLATEAGMITLGHVSTDVDRFEAAADGVLRSGDPEVCVQAADLYGGDLLPDDPYASWVQEPRERLRLRVLAVLKAGHLWERVLEVDRTDEQAHQELMRAHLAAGNRREAMRQFERLREALRGDLGVAPDRRSVALYEEVLAMEGDQPPTPAERCRALLAWGLVHWNGGDLAEAERTATQARALAVSTGLGRELGEASALLGLVAQARGEWMDLFRQEFLQSVRQTPDLASFVFAAHLCLAEFSLYGSHGHEQATPFARELLRVAERAGSVAGQAVATLMLGEAELLTGNLAAADDHLARAARLHELAGGGSGFVLALHRQAEAAIATGRRARAGLLLHRAMRLADADPLAPHLRVRVFHGLVQAARNPQDAYDVIEKAERSLAYGDVCQPCSMGFHVAAAIGSARIRDLRGARRHLDACERIAGLWRGGPWTAAVWETRGALRLAEGHRAQAVALYREAADLFARFSRPLDAARCLAATHAHDGAE